MNALARARAEWNLPQPHHQTLPLLRGARASLGQSAATRAATSTRSARRVSRARRPHRQPRHRCFLKTCKPKMTPSRSTRRRKRRTRTRGTRARNQHQHQHQHQCHVWSQPRRTRKRASRRARSRGRSPRIPSSQRRLQRPRGSVQCARRRPPQGPGRARRRCVPPCRRGVPSRCCHSRRASSWCRGARAQPQRPHSSHTRAAAPLWPPHRSSPPRESPQASAPAAAPASPRTRTPCPCPSRSRSHCPRRCRSHSPSPCCRPHRCSQRRCARAGGGCTAPAGATAGARGAARRRRGATARVRARAAPTAPTAATAAQAVQAAMGALEQSRLQQQ